MKVIIVFCKINNKGNNIDNLLSLKQKLNSIEKNVSSVGYNFRQKIQIRLNSL